MFKGCIYRHWIVNDKGIEKSYIGLHSGNQPEKDRWGKNGNGYKPQNSKKPTKFYNAIRKYGWHNFNHDILEWVEVETLEELMSTLKNKEKYYIEQYDSYHNGYNSTLGGDGAITSDIMKAVKAIIGVWEGNRNNSYNNFTKVYNIIINFSHDEKNIFLNEIIEYLRKDKNVIAYKKRLQTKFNIVLDMYEFAYNMFFKQFSFKLVYWEHLGLRNGQRAFGWELLFKNRFGVAREITSGQLCRLHSTLYNIPIYAKNTFWSNNVKTLWHNDVIYEEHKTVEQRRKDKEQQNVLELKEKQEIFAKWSQKGCTPHYIHYKITVDNQDEWMKKEYDGNDIYLVTYIREWNESVYSTYFTKKGYEAYFETEIEF